MPYSPLGRGFLTGAIEDPDKLSSGDSRVKRYPRFAQENFLQNRKLVERVGAIAERKGVTAAQLALAWVLAKGEDIVPIPGTKHRKYLEENAAAVGIHLTAAETAKLEQAVPKDEVAGERYTTSNMRAIDC